MSMLHLTPRVPDGPDDGSILPLPVFVSWRVGWSVAAGFRGQPGTFGPRLEIRADVRRLEPEVAGLFGFRQDWLRVYTASAGIQFP